MSIIQVKPDTKRIPLGRQGENLASIIWFNLSGWQAEFGEGVPKLIHKRCGDRIAYPVALRVEGSAAYWDVTNADTEAPGCGQCELSYYVDDVIVRSATYITDVSPSMAAMKTGHVPRAVPSWVDAVNGAIAQAETAAGEATGATQEAADAAQEAQQAALAAQEAAAKADEAAKTYTLPIADGEQLGGVKIGAGITATPDGAISVDEETVGETAKTVAASVLEEYTATEAEIAEMFKDVFGTETQEGDQAGETDGSQDQETGPAEITED